MLHPSSVCEADATSSPFDGDHFRHLRAARGAAVGGGDAIFLALFVAAKFDATRLGDCQRGLDAIRHLLAQRRRLHRAI
jgi:hypothetical protein